MTGHEQSYAENKRVRARLVSELNAARVREAQLRMALTEAVGTYRSRKPAWADKKWEAAENAAIRLAHGEAALARLLRWEELLARPQVAIAGSEVFEASEKGEQ